MSKIQMVAKDLKPDEAEKLQGWVNALMRQVQDAATAAAASAELRIHNNAAPPAPKKV
jgi:hypothetical protein